MGIIRAQVLQLVSSALVAAGCVLMFVELGAVESSATVSLPGYSHAAGARLTGWGDSRLNRQPGETDFALATRLNRVIGEAIYHCAYSDTLRAVDRIAYAVFGTHAGVEVGLITPRALTCGFCHQSAYVLARALANAGVKAFVLGLNGHVVTAIESNGRRVIFDPDFGVGPFAYDELASERTTLAYSHRIDADPQVLAAIRGALRESSDDDEYLSMRELDLLELKQNGLLGLIGWIAAICFCAACCYGGSATISLWRRLTAARRGSTTSREKANSI